MSRTPRVTGAELITALTKAGFTVMRSKVDDLHNLRRL
jgi:predicted RNA binding protein YcfA (HicA-like mRNA interferase family)